MELEGASPLGVLEDLRDCFEVGAGREMVFGGSAALLDKMLENDIGSEVLVALGSSLLLIWFCLGGSLLLRSWDGGRSKEPFGRFVEAEPP